jgi:hypothetical protein
MTYFYVFLQKTVYNSVVIILTIFVTSKTPQYFLQFVYVFRMILRVNADYFLDSRKRLFFVIKRGCVFFEVRTEILCII